MLSLILMSLFNLFFKESANAFFCSSVMLEKEITLDWEDSIPKLVARDSFEPGLGARPMKRFIQEHFETALAERILNKSLNAGDVFTITRDLMK